VAEVVQREEKAWAAMESFMAKPKRSRQFREPVGTALVSERVAAARASWRGNSSGAALVIRRWCNMTRAQQLDADARPVGSRALAGDSGKADWLTHEKHNGGSCNPYRLFG